MGEKEEPGVKRMTMLSAEGGKYVGETTEAGIRQGRGEYMWPNGDRYTGDFGNGVKMAQELFTFLMETRELVCGRMTNFMAQLHIILEEGELMKKFGRMTTKLQKNEESDFLSLRLKNLSLKCTKIL